MDAIRSQLTDAGKKIAKLESGNFELRAEVERLRAENAQLKSGLEVAAG